MTLRICIIGRPNVGKSTLFNRLAGKRSAIVHDMPGVTRDWKEEPGNFGHMEFTVLDTPGLAKIKGDELASRMSGKAIEAASNSDALILVVDALSGLTGEDSTFAKQIRKLGKKIILVANKCENPGNVRSNLHEFDRLGFGEAILVSAEHNLGMHELMEAVANCQEEVPGSELSVASEEEEKGSKPIKIAILGRPNVGKSSLVNALVGSERLLTGPEAGITRDSVELDFNYSLPLAPKPLPLKIVDTAGLRRRGKVDEDLEKISNSQSIKSLKFCEIAVIVLDPDHPLEKQDLIIASFAEEEGRGIVIALNKIDTVRNPAVFLEQFRKRLENALPQIKGVSLVALSAHKKQGLDDLVKAIVETHENWNRRIPTAKLNSWLEEALVHNPAPLNGSRRLRLKYASQIKSRPPTFVLFANMSDKLPDTYERYLVNDLRREFDLPGVPIRFRLKESKNPYAEK